MKYLGKILLFNVYLFQSMSFFPCERHFSSLLGSKGGQKRGSKFAISNKIIPKSWIFAERYNFWSQILYCHSFSRYHSFWPFLEHPRGQKRSKIVHFSKSNTPEAANLHREVISHQRFDTVTHLGQITNFDSFWGILGVK